MERTRDPLINQIDLIQYFQKEQNRSVVQFSTSPRQFNQAGEVNSRVTCSSVSPADAASATSVKWVTVHRVCCPEATFSKLLLRKISYLRRIIGKYLAKHNLELGNNDAILIVINSFIFTFCWKLLRDIVVKSLVSK